MSNLNIIFSMYMLKLGYMHLKGTHINMRNTFGAWDSCFECK